MQQKYFFKKASHNLLERAGIFYMLVFHKDEMYQLWGSLFPFLAARLPHRFLLLPKMDFCRLSAVLAFSIIKLISKAITFRITRFPISRLIGSKCLAALLPASLQHFANGSFPSVGITHRLLGVLLLHCNFRWSGNNQCSCYMGDFIARLNRVRKQE